MTGISLILSESVAMPRSLNAIVSALCTTLALQARPPEGAVPRCYNRVTRFVLGQFSNTPFHMRAPLTLAIYLFGYSSVLFYGKPFTLLCQRRREAWVARWKAASLSPFRDFVRYFEGLSLFLLYSENHD